MARFTLVVLLLVATRSVLQLCWSGLATNDDSSQVSFLAPRTAGHASTAGLEGRVLRKASLRGTRSAGCLFCSGSSGGGWQVTGSGLARRRTAAAAVAFEPSADVVERAAGEVESLLGIVESIGESHEGNCYTGHESMQRLACLYNKRLNLVNLAQRFGDRGMLEIGFNSGLSATLLLIATAGVGARLVPQGLAEQGHVCVDIGDHKYTRPCGDFMQNRFPGRFELYLGDSTEVMPGLPADVRVGLVHVDGSHQEEVLQQDMLNSDARLLDGGAMIIDDTNIPPLSALVDAWLAARPNEYQEVRMLQPTFPYSHRVIVKRPPPAAPPPPPAAA